MMPMIATTISSSISVKPRAARILLMELSRYLPLMKRQCQCQDIQVDRARRDCAALHDSACCSRGFLMRQELTL
jgi:hypothetical protein